MGVSEITRRIMRLIVLFDLPTVSKIDKRSYVEFRRFLLRDGYDMIQWSVYGRLINGFDDMEKHVLRLNSHLPPFGSVRCWQITEKQFTDAKILVGSVTCQEKLVKSTQLLLF